MLAAHPMQLVTDYLDEQVRCLDDRESGIWRVRPWSAHSVFVVKNRELIKHRTDELSGGLPRGNPGWIRYWQEAVKHVKADLSQDDMERSGELAEKWNVEGPSPDIQIR